MQQANVVQFNVAERCIAAGTACRQLGEAGGKNVSGVLNVNHKHQDFLRAVGIAVTQPFLS
ncbi:hypothetical protein SRABI106_04034 [Rahnella aquatilis]|nr:hypothetical protein SRABI106_04034 [Rahnella aquatilis]